MKGRISLALLNRLKTLIDKADEIPPQEMSHEEWKECKDLITTFYTLRKMRRHDEREGSFGKPDKDGWVIGYQAQPDAPGRFETIRSGKTRKEDYDGDRNWWHHDRSSPRLYPDKWRRVPN